MFNADMRRGSEWPVNMIKAVRAGRESCSVLSWVFRLDRMGPRMAGAGSGRSWVVVGDGCVWMTRLSGVTFGVTPTKKRKTIRQQD